jgi:hypothetical protein
VRVDHGARPARSAELVFTVGIYSLRVKLLTGLRVPPPDTPSRTFFLADATHTNKFKAYMPPPPSPTYLP